MSRSVLVAMSGGVDSSVAAALLLEAGWDVTGVTMRLWGGESDTGCCSVSDVDDARRVAQQLGIDHLVFNFSEDFDARVVGPYVDAHARGTTPNPCIECNRHIKFDRLVRRADLLGFDAVATGHHARVVEDGLERRLARAVDRAKDQSYVLHMLDGRHLARTLLPIGSMDKAAVRATAAQLGLRTAAKPDSQDVCFITSTGGRAAFLGRRLPLTAGRVVDRDGTELGRVDAVELVTLGQRRGVGTGGGGTRRYVVGIDRETATITVGTDVELLTERQLVQDLHWLGEPVGGTFLAQCSAHGQPAACELDPAGALRWHEPQRRVAPGQSIVLYDETDTFVLAGGVAA
jgi:tRNA-specific 2-thiouridylase